MKEVISQTQTDRKGLGSSSAKWWSKTEGTEKRDMLIDEVRQWEDFRRIQKTIQQGQWTNWDSEIQRSLTRSFIRSVYDLLLQIWYAGEKKDDLTCPLCHADKLQNMS
ncbi:reverse transcriptase [Elysia marginata]|uniref:Reverse transcriptase n=1 Tax=Elysia marginata TaxID=1093978 RepID=A0AAV4FUX3_9GAST|nr:reverse transcriptase [Elysia marginata]